MIMLRGVRLLDPSTRTDGIRDILIAEGKIIRVGEDLWLDASLIARFLTVRVSARRRVLWTAMSISGIRARHTRKIS